MEQAYRLGVPPDRLAKEIVDRGQLGVAVTEVLRAKALDLLAERAAVTDEAGNPVDVKAITAEAQGEAEAEADAEAGDDAEAGADGAEDSAAGGRGAAEARSRERGRAADAGAAETRAAEAEPRRPSQPRPARPRLGDSGQGGQVGAGRPAPTANRARWRTTRARPRVRVTSTAQVVNGTWPDGTVI